MKYRVIEIKDQSSTKFYPQWKAWYWPFWSCWHYFGPATGNRLKESYSSLENAWDRINQERTPPIRPTKAIHLESE